MLKLLFAPGRHSVSTSIGLLVLRVCVAGMMLGGHGLGKLLKFGELAAKFPDPLHMGSRFSLMAAIGAEVFCSIAVILGLFTRFSVLPLVFTMCVAAFVIHGSDPFSGKELALMYLVPFLTLVFTGAGRFSLDQLFSGEKKG